MNMSYNHNCIGINVLRVVTAAIYNLSTSATQQQGEQISLLIISQMLQQVNSLMFWCTYGNIDLALLLQ